METSLAVVPLGTLNQLLHYVGKSGKIETMMKVIESFSFIPFLIFITNTTEFPYAKKKLFSFWPILSLMCDAFVVLFMSYAVVLQNSCIRWRSQLLDLFNSIKKSFGSWKLEEICGGKIIEVPLAFCI